MSKALQKRIDSVILEEIKLLKQHFKKDKWDLDYSYIISDVYHKILPSVEAQLLNTINKAGMILTVNKKNNVVITKFSTHKQKAYKAKKKRKS